jgi:hypothetical protein
MSLVEAVATVVLCIFMPVIVVWAQISLAQVIENIGDLMPRGFEMRLVFSPESSKGRQKK